MTTNRRDFIKRSAVLSGAIGAGLTLPSSLAAAFAEPRLIEQARTPLRILILGGTGFIGPHQVRYAAARGHKVTVFNRGRRNPGILKDVPNVTEVVGDRAPKPGNYESLKTGEWDVVIDNPTTIPRWVREASEVLKGRVNQYIFISTISVYAANDTPNADETAAVGTTDTPDVEGTALPANAQPGAIPNPNAVPGALYGPLKALSEKEAEKHFPGRTTVIRPGLIVGVGDTTDRYSYWPVRVERANQATTPEDPARYGVEVLAPPANQLLQFIDARDLSEWAIRCAENKVYGVFNATGPKEPVPFGQLLPEIKRTLNSKATVTHVSAEFLQAQQVRTWAGPGSLAAWINQDNASNAGFMKRSVAKAQAAGLTYRSHAETIRETLAFFRTLPPDRQEALASGLTPARERELLALWKARG